MKKEKIYFQFYYIFKTHSKAFDLPIYYFEVGRLGIHVTVYKDWITERNYEMVFIYSGAGMSGTESAIICIKIVANSVLLSMRFMYFEKFLFL